MYIVIHARHTRKTRSLNFLWSPGRAIERWWAGWTSTLENERKRDGQRESKEPIWLFHLNLFNAAPLPFILSHVTYINGSFKCRLFPTLTLRLQCANVCSAYVKSVPFKCAFRLYIQGVSKRWYQILVVYIVLVKTNQKVLMNSTPKIFIVH